MERLTTRREDGRIETTGMSYSEIHMGYVPSARVNDKYDVRLAEYEDTGLTPEELKRTLKKYPVAIDKETQIIVDKHAFDSNMDEIVALRDRLQQAEADNAALVEGLKLGEQLKTQAIEVGALLEGVHDDTWQKIQGLNATYTAISGLINTDHPGAAILKELEGYKRALVIACQYTVDPETVLKMCLERAKAEVSGQ